MDFLRVETIIIDIKLEGSITLFLKIPHGPVSLHAWKTCMKLKSGSAEAFLCKQLDFLQI